MKNRLGFVWTLLALLLPLSRSFQTGRRPAAPTPRTRTRRRKDPRIVVITPLAASIPDDVEKDSSSGRSNSNYGEFVDLQRRRVWKQTAVQVASVLTAGAAIALLTRPAWAASKSRTVGYEVQKSESEWRKQLSPMQYFVLREGGTERPGFSLLVDEKRLGTFECAGCGTPLFSTSDKFNSGTGWPSFARALPGVEVEAVNPFTANLAGAELRCKTCGGHLGDVFNDGFLFLGTEAAVTGKRYCIDGAALVFYPESNTDATPVRGDIPAGKPADKKLPSFLEPPKVTPRDD